MRPSRSDGRCPKLTPAPRRDRYHGQPQNLIKAWAFEMSRPSCATEGTKSRNYQYRRDNNMNKLAIFLVAAAIGYFYQESMARQSVKDPRSDEQVIRISAKTFEFQPSEITVKKGIPVMLELISADRHHGFKLSAFQLRADVTPGSVETVRFVPDRTGTFTFLCDVFCGDGHENMSGTLTVIE